MAAFDIIPDIHGQFAKLEHLLSELGYRERGGGWHHAEPSRQIVFLGDFIDRGPENEKVLRTVQNLMDSGRAVAVMGNHELNAIHFHTKDPETGRSLRPQNQKNKTQHASFLNEFPCGSARARREIEWMARLPLWLDLGRFRVVHACWSKPAIDRLVAHASDGILSEDQLIEAGRAGSELHDDVEVLTKGPEIGLPEGFVFHDKDAHPRREMRLAWWRAGATSWWEAAVSVPDLSALPISPRSRTAACPKRRPKPSIRSTQNQSSSGITGWSRHRCSKRRTPFASTARPERRAR